MPESLYTTETPAGFTSESPGPTVGTVIVVAVAGSVTHLKWYCPPTPPSNSAAVPFVLYDATTQDELRRVTAAVVSGWNTVAITPYAASAGQRLIAAVYTATNYSFSAAFFNSSDTVVGNLTAPATGNTAGGNGRFRTGADGVPTSTFNGNNYWTDIVFTATAGTTPVTSSLTVKWRVYGKVTSSLTTKWRVYAKVSSILTSKWRVYAKVSAPITIKWRVYGKVTTTLTAKWRVYMSMGSSTLIGKWRNYTRVVSRLTAKWTNNGAPAPEPVVSTAYLSAQRAATAAYIRDDPTTLVLVPRSRTATPAGGYTYVDGAPRPAQTVKMILLNSDQRPRVTVAGVERLIDYHMLGPWNMQVAVGDTWEAEDGTKWEIVGFTEGWDYMTKAHVSRAVPRGGKP